MSGTHPQSAHDAFSVGVQKVLVKVRPELGVEKTAIAAIDAIVDKILVRTVSRALEEARQKKPTSSSPSSSLTTSGILSSSPNSMSFLSPQREIRLSYVEMQAALSHIFPADLFGPADAEATRQLTAYWAAKEEEERDDDSGSRRKDADFDDFEVVATPFVTLDSAHNVKRITSAGNLSAPRIQLDLAFSVELVSSRLLLEREFARVMFDESAPLYLSGVLEWLTTRVAEAAGRVSSEIGLGEIIEEHVQTAIFKDESLKRLIWGAPLVERRKEEDADAARRNHEANVAKMLEEERKASAARIAKMREEQQAAAAKPPTVEEQLAAAAAETPSTAGPPATFTPVTTPSTPEVAEEPTASVPTHETAAPVAPQEEEPEKKKKIEEPEQTEHIQPPPEPTIPTTTADLALGKEEVKEVEEEKEEEKEEEEREEHKPPQAAPLAESKVKPVHPEEPIKKVPSSHVSSSAAVSVRGENNRQFSLSAGPLGYPNILVVLFGSLVALSVQSVCVYS